MRDLPRTADAWYTGYVLINSHTNSMFEKLKQYKDLRDKAKTIQGKLKEITVHASADGGRVQVVMDGNQQVLGVEIDPDALRIEKREELQKHITEAMNDAVKKSQMEMAKSLKNTPGFNLPNLS